MWNYLNEPPGMGVKISKKLVEVAMMELICFLCHCKDNNNVYTFVSVLSNLECFLSYYSLSVPPVPNRGVYG